MIGLGHRTFEEIPNEQPPARSLVEYMERTSPDYLHAVVEVSYDGDPWGALLGPRGLEDPQTLPIYFEHGLKG